MIARDALISALSEAEFIEIKELNSTFEIWTKLETLYEGDKYTKPTKLHD